MKDFESDLAYGFSRYIGPDDEEVFSAYCRATKAELALEAYDEREEDYVHWSIPFINRAIVDIEGRYNIKEKIKFGVSASFYATGRPRSNNSPRTIVNNDIYYIFVPGDMIAALVQDLSAMDFTRVAELLSMPDGNYQGEKSSGVLVDSLLSSFFGNTGRTNIVNMLTQLCLSFWVYHEMVHIKNGHLKLMAQSPIISTFDKRILQRAFEFDADALAMSWLIDRVSRQYGAEFSVHYHGGPVDPVVIRDEQDVITVAILAALICFSIYRGAIASDHHWDGSHPPMGLRVISAINQISTLARRHGWFGTDDAMINNALGKAVHACSCALSPVADLKRVITREDLELEGAYRHEVGLLWNVVRPFLERHCLGGGIPPSFVAARASADDELKRARDLDWWPEIEVVAARLATAFDAV